MKWISVLDQKPVKKVNFEKFLVTDGRYIYVGEPWNDENEPLEWIDSNCYILKDISHWMPLPELPR
jgi:hypothetical protein